ncbi:hypothetical protein PF008_g21746, partial [Phytophthora fragariae]
MASETAALYERILTLVPKDELVCGYNEVLREEVSSVNRAINDVSVTFAKLEGVRDAVTKLSNGSSGDRSESLLEVMDSTMELQCNLKRKMKLVLAEMDELRDDGAVDAGREGQVAGPRVDDRPRRVDGLTVQSEAR